MLGFIIGVSSLLFAVFALGLSLTFWNIVGLLSVPIFTSFYLIDTLFIDFNNWWYVLAILIQLATTSALTNNEKDEQGS